MANWIKIEKATPTKAEILAMAAELKIDPDAVLGKLVRLWCWADDNTETGHVKSVTLALLDSIIGRVGFAEAMQNAGWIVETKDGVRFPKYDRHMSESAKKRALAAERQSRKRNAKNVTQALPDQNRTEENCSDPDHIKGQNQHPSLKVNEYGDTLYHASGYDGDDGRIFYEAAALVVDGRCHRDKANDAARAAKKQRAGNRPGYFRRVLDEHLGGKLEKLIDGMNANSLPKHPRKSKPADAAAGLAERMGTDG